MKMFYILVLVSIFTLEVTSQETKVSKYDPEFCKVFQDKIKTYKETMRDDAYAKKTLESYKKRAKIYCTK